MLAYLLIWKWACEGRRIVAAKAGVLSNRPILFCSEGAFVLTADELASELENPDVM